MANTGDLGSSVRVLKSVMIPIGQLHPNPWNPNQMSDEKFNQLCAKVEDEGFGEPLKVIELDEFEFEDGWDQSLKHYRIWAGEHRYRVGRVLEMTELPCYVSKDMSEEEQKLKTVRDNLVRGELDSTKFTALVKSLDEGMDIDPQLFGFADEVEMAKYLIKDKTEKDSTFLDGFLAEANKQKEAVDSLSDIVSTLFQQAAETLDQSFLAFAYKGQTHCVVLCNSDCFKEVQRMTDHLQQSGGDINDFMTEAIRQNLVAPQKEG